MELKNLSVIFLALNGLFWGLDSHENHCVVAAKMGSPCATHKTHVTIGILCFLIAVYIQQKDALRL